MKIKRHIAAVLTAAVVVAAVITSMIAVAHGSEHHCTGDDCPVCALVAVCENTLKTLSGVPASFFAAVPVCFAVVFIAAFCASSDNVTPVSLKVKLLD